MHVCTHACMHACVRVCMHVCMHMCVSICIYLCKWQQNFGTLHTCQCHLTFLSANVNHTSHACHLVQRHSTIIETELKRQMLLHPLPPMTPLYTQAITPKPSDRCSLSCAHAQTNMYIDNNIPPATPGPQLHER